MHSIIVAAYRNRHSNNVLKWPYLSSHRKTALRWKGNSRLHSDKKLQWGCVRIPPEGGSNELPGCSTEPDDKRKDGNQSD